MIKRLLLKKTDRRAAKYAGGCPVRGEAGGKTVKQILNQVSDQWRASFYRTSAQAEVDLILEGANQQVWAIEVKRSLAPTVSKGFYYGCHDIKATDKFVIYPGNDSFPLAQDIEAMGVLEFLNMLHAKQIG